VNSSSNWRRSGAELLLLAAILLVVIQILPLPDFIRSTLTPNTAELLPLWMGGVSDGPALGPWETLSLAPAETRGGLVMLLAYAALFVVVVQRLETMDDVERVLRWIAFSVVAMAGIGLAQYLIGNGRFLWVYEHPARDTTGAAKGMFINQNHFAHFLALGIGPIILWLRQATRSGPKEKRFRLRASRSNSSKRLRNLLPGIMLGVVAFAGLLSFSRGGVAAVLLAAGVTVAIFTRAALLGRRSVLVLAGVAVVLVGALLIHGYSSLTQELERLDYRSIDDFSRQEIRSEVWRANLAGIRDFGLVGTGIGSHRSVLPTYFDKTTNVEFRYAENGYLQVALEAGLPGVALLLIGIGLCCWWCGRAYMRADSSRAKACVGAVTGGILASVLHSLVDFVWYILACISLTLVLAACACRLNQISGQQTRTVSPGVQPPTSSTPTPRLKQVAWGIASCVLLVIGASMLGNLLPAAKASSRWEQFERAAFANNDSAGQEPQAEYSLDWLCEHVAAALESDPDNSLAHLHMASLSIRQFELAQQASDNPMPLTQIRHAVEVSEFGSVEEKLRWLEVAVGDNLALLRKSLNHAQRAVQLCPLHGEGYIYLADLSFLESNDGLGTHTLVDQALNVRPHSGRVLVAAGIHAALAGDEPEAWRC